MSAPPRGDPVRNAGGRGAGRWLFALGMAAIGVVFVLAAITFAKLPKEIADPARVAEQGLGRMVVAAVVKAVFLLVMAYAGSLFASKGLELYQAACGKEGQ